MKIEEINQLEEEKVLRFQGRKSRFILTKTITVL